jgi:hypothetical protein
MGTQACASCAASRSSILFEDIPQDGPLQWGRLKQKGAPPEATFDLLEGARRPPEGVERRLRDLRVEKG